MTAMVMMLLSCENSIEKVREFEPDDTLTSVVAYNITLLRSDSGVVILELKAPVLNQFDDKENTLEFPKGFEAVFFNSQNHPVSYIRADYGISGKNQKMVNAKGNVEVKNYDTDEQMNSEMLFWNQDEKMIYTRSKVKITAPDKIIFGDSLSATEDFSRRTIHNVHNTTIEIEENE